MTPLSRESQERIDEYLTRLRESLLPLSEGERTDAVEELRTHIEEAVTQIREDEAAAVSTVLRGLGEPAQYAAGLMAEDTDEGPAAGPQPGPVAPPVRRKGSAGWCIAGCIAVPVLLVVAWVGFYFWAQAPAPPGVAHDAELGHLQQKLLSALSQRDAAGMAALLHPDLLAEGGVSGEDLLLPEGVGRLSVGEASRVGPDKIRISVRADGTVYEYEFERHAGQWLIRGVHGPIRDAPVAGDGGAPEASEPSEPE
jgi:hypothetical protein